MCPTTPIRGDIFTFSLLLISLATFTPATAVGRSSLSRSKSTDRGKLFNHSPVSVVTVNGSDVNSGETIFSEDEETQYPFDAVSSNSSFIKVEEQVPAIPSSLKTDVTATSIYVSWSPPRNNKIRVRGYTIGWGIGFPDVYSKVLDVRSRSYTIENLQPGSEYVISLRAYNAAGDGQPAYDNVRTLQIDAVEGSSVQLFPPVGLKTHVLSPTSIQLQWSDTSNRPINEVRLYIIRYASVQRMPSNKFRYANTSKTSIVIDDLKASTQYEFSVKLVRGRLESMWSMSVVNRTLDSVPSSTPRNLTVKSYPTGNGTSVYLHWQPLKQFSSNAPINGYTVVYYRQEDRSNGDRWLSHTVAGVESSETLIHNLSADSSYVFQIQAYNSAGHGPSAASVSFQTDSSKKLSISRGRGLSTATVVTVTVSIAAMTIILFLIIALLSCRSKRPAGDTKNRKGVNSSLHVSYSPAASYCKDECESQQLHPPDLWIHHHEQLELKSSDKSDLQDEMATGAPILRTFRESEGESVEAHRASGHYLHTSSSLYDMTRNLPFDATVQSSYPSTAAITTLRRAPRSQATLLINGASDSAHVFNINTPSNVTSISRCLCPGSHAATLTSKAPQCTFEISDQLKAPPPRYNPLSYNSSDLAPFNATNWFNNNIAASYSSSGNASSCALSPTDASSSLTTSTPSLNNLTARPLPGLQSITGYTVTTSVTTDPHSQPSNISKHIAVKPQVIPPHSTGNFEHSDNVDTEQLKKDCHGRSNSTVQSII